jgi:hypothetical protein
MLHNLWSWENVVKWTEKHMENQYSQRNFGWANFSWKMLVALFVLKHEGRDNLSLYWVWVARFLCQEVQVTVPYTCVFFFSAFSTRYRWRHFALQKIKLTTERDYDCEWWISIDMEWSESDLSLEPGYYQGNLGQDNQTPVQEPNQRPPITNQERYNYLNYDICSSQALIQPNFEIKLKSVRSWDTRCIIKCPETLCRIMLVLQVH